MARSLSARESTVLQAVVRLYVEEAVPVASRKVAGCCGLGLSPATIRSVMGELESKGLLVQAHRSAGRLPSEAGLRLYVDSILEVEQLPSADRTRIRRALREYRNDPVRALQEASRLLSQLSDHAGVVVAPRFEEAPLKSSRFLLLEPGQVLAVFCDEAGLIHSRLVTIEEDLEQSELDRLSGCLNARIKGMSLRKLREVLSVELAQELGRLGKRLSTLVKLAGEALEDEDVVYVGGRANILNHPEFADLRLLRQALNALEEKRLLVRLLSGTAEAPGVTINIGKGRGRLAPIAGMSLVSSGYRLAGGSPGSLGIIGPQRMDYSRVVPLVDYTAWAIGKLLNN